MTTPAGIVHVQACSPACRTWWVSTGTFESDKSWNSSRRTASMARALFGTMARPAAGLRAIAMLVLLAAQELGPSANPPMPEGPARRLPRAQSKGPHLDNTMRANQLRLWFSSMAYVALCALRRIGSRHSRFAPTASPSASGASRSPWLRHPLTSQAVHRKPCQKAKDRHGSTQAGVRPKAAQTDFKRSMPAPWSAPPDHHSNLIDV